MNFQSGDGRESLTKFLAIPAFQTIPKNETGTEEKPIFVFIWKEQFCFRR